MTDGFAGNVALKSLEGGIASLMAVMKQEIMSTLKGKIGGLLLKDAFRAIKNKMDYNKQEAPSFWAWKKLWSRRTILQSRGGVKRRFAGGGSSRPRYHRKNQIEIGGQHRGNGLIYDL